MTNGNPSLTPTLSHVFSCSRKSLSDIIIFPIRYKRASKYVLTKVDISFVLVSKNDFQICIIDVIFHVKKYMSADAISTPTPPGDSKHLIMISLDVA